MAEPGSGRDHTVTIDSVPQADLAADAKPMPTPWKRTEDDDDVEIPSADAGDDELLDHERLDDEAEAEPPAGRTWSRLAVRSAFLLCALSIAALVVGGIYGGKWLNDAQRDNDRVAALAAARQVAVNMATINFATGRQDIQRILDSGTGDFANQFKANVDSYLDVVGQAQVVSTGSVVESGVSSLDGDNAKVTVALTSKVKNKDNPAGEDRWYRMSVELQRQTDGRWLASRVEFVQ